LNYLREINAFEKQMRQHPLSPTAQLLWYKLMQFANLKFWPESFQMDHSTVLDMLNTKSDHAVMVARKEIIQAGYLIYTRGKPGTYSLIPPSSKESPANASRQECQEEDFLLQTREENDLTRYFGWTEETALELDHITSVLFAEFLPGTEPTDEDRKQVFNYTQIQAEDNGSFSIQFPKERKELLAYAFEIARKNHAVNWHYINGIYRNFSARGIETREDAIAYEYEHRGGIK